MEWRRLLPGSLLRGASWGGGGEVGPFGGLGLWVLGLGFGVSGLGFRVEGCAGFRVWGLGL